MASEFEFDPDKSESNRVKHGVDFVQAQVLWAGGGVERPLPHSSEERRIRLGLIEGKLWAAIFTLREGSVRLISVRRARRAEEQEYDRQID